MQEEHLIDKGLIQNFNKIQRFKICAINVPSLLNNHDLFIVPVIKSKFLVQFILH